VPEKRSLPFILNTLPTFYPSSSLSLSNRYFLEIDKSPILPLLSRTYISLNLLFPRSLFPSISFSLDLFLPRFFSRGGDFLRKTWFFEGWDRFSSWVTRLGLVRYSEMLRRCEVFEYWQTGEVGWQVGRAVDWSRGKLAEPSIEVDRLAGLSIKIEANW